MKKSIFITILSFVFCCFAHADIPTKKPLSYYSKLWTPSLFTTPPDPILPPATKSPFDDYHLTNVAPIDGGYWITITHKKDKKTIVIQPGSNSKFKIVSVERNPETRLGTVVSLTDGQFTGQVRFEPDLVALNTPVNTPQPDQLPPGFNPNQPNQQQPPGQVAPPTPRPRIVPPSKPNPNPANNNSQTRPQRTR